MLALRGHAVDDDPPPLAPRAGPRGRGVRGRRRRRHPPGAARDPGLAATRAGLVPEHAPAALPRSRARATTRGPRRPLRPGRHGRPRRGRERRDLFGLSDPRRRCEPRREEVDLRARSSGLARRRERGGGPDEVRAEPRVRAPAPSVALALLLGAAHAGAQESAAPTRLEPVVVTPTRLDQQAGHAPGTVALLTRRAPS